MIKKCWKRYNHIWLTQFHYGDIKWFWHLVLNILREHSLSAQNMITEKTNELLTRNAETLKMVTIETAKEAERSVVDIATLKRCNQ